MHLFGLWKLEYPKRVNTGKHGNSTQKGTPLDSNPGPSCCEVTFLTTALPPGITWEKIHRHPHQSIGRCWAENKSTHTSLTASRQLYDFKDCFELRITEYLLCFLHRATEAPLWCLPVFDDCGVTCCQQKFSYWSSYSSVRYMIIAIFWFWLDIILPCHVITWFKIALLCAEKCTVTMMPQRRETGVLRCF